MNICAKGSLRVSPVEPTIHFPENLKIACLIGTVVTQEQVNQWNAEGAEELKKQRYE